MRTLDPSFLDQFLAGYMAAATWSSPAPPHSRKEFLDGTTARWTKRAKAQAQCLCWLFCRACEADLLEAEARGRAADCLGHDLWLTAAGHGTGFWDREELDGGGLVDRLTSMAESRPWAHQSIGAYRGKIDFD